MDIKALITFQTIIKQGSFQGAAEELNYVQSTVTSQIQKLELDLGVKLFERGRKLRLTEAGRILTKQAAYILNDIDSLRKTISDFTEGETGNLRIGSMEPTASLRLPNVLNDYCNDHKKVQINLEIGNSTTIRERILSGQLDLGICTSPDIEMGLDFTPLFVEKIGLLLPVDHKLVMKNDIKAKDLQGERLILTGRNCAYRRKLEKLLLEKGNHVMPIVQSGSIEVVKKLVEKGLGIGIIPEVSHEFTSTTVLKSINDFELDVTIGLLKRKDESPSRAMQNLINAITISLKRSDCMVM
ncbi:LysR family transcriptional regulator [Neobacillus ginsengisoli]|uniref:DNA-binding transcriptional LysR family regulator n=1 Tax=Neobacillus ginsengisoli TaxID=904295 RepID=A0ABT9Y0V5_9BACI|nr:LysR family transcriptional regulator [Neobacillus ginsengisoli]MDQ0201443.1 DNA-binding transcriptional LysR family regulator [Neobacillus ginsengisoli]